MRKLKGLEEAIGSRSCTGSWPSMAGRSRRTRRHPATRSTATTICIRSTRQARPGYTGRATVPVLWDRQTRTIVNNESAEIIRMLNSAFDAVGAQPGDYYPEALASEIDAVNALVYDTSTTASTRPASRRRAGL